MPRTANPEAKRGPGRPRKGAEPRIKEGTEIEMKNSFRAAAIAAADTAYRGLAAASSAAAIAAALTAKAAAEEAVAALGPQVVAYRTDRADGGRFLSAVAWWPCGDRPFALRTWAPRGARRFTIK